MSRLLLLCSIACALLIAQAPTGIIEGSVTDESGSFMPRVRVLLLHKETGLTRTEQTASDGTYTFSTLAAGEYEVRAEAAGFRTLVRAATVETGATTTVNLNMQVGATKEVVTVEAAAAQISYDSHSIEGVINRQKIENLPLNGRSFLQLAQLEPGVTISIGNAGQYNSLFNVSILGGLSTRTGITVDGGSVWDQVTGNTGMNFSQEVVQEFQLSSVNFDLSTGITGVGAINVVTRSGSNDFHGSGYFYFRDHNMAAYPLLARNPLTRDPYFARKTPGFWFGGPIKQNKLFFFFNLEKTYQKSVFSYLPDSPLLAAFAQTSGAPYQGLQLSARLDYRFNDKHSMFLRYSHDGATNEGPNGAITAPSDWLTNRNWSDQGIFGVTSILKPTLVNDFRFSFWYWNNRNFIIPQSDCGGSSCFGYGLPRIDITSSNFTFGDSTNAPQGRDLRRWSYSDSMTWQRASHRIRFGGELQHHNGVGFWNLYQPGRVIAYGPDFLKSFGLLGTYGIPANGPQNLQDLLKLPLYAFYVGIGDPAQPPGFHQADARKNNRYHFFGQDTWRVRPSFTLNYGVAWSYEDHLLNYDLTKPQYLAPILGSNSLDAGQHEYHDFSPALGFAWNVGHDNKTVIRGGAGLYYDTQLLWQRLEERSYIGPPGNGLTVYNSSAIPNPFAGIPGAPQNAPTYYVNGPTGFTLGQALQYIGTATATLNTRYLATKTDDLTLRGINITKQASDLYLDKMQTPYAEHFNIGVQRELRHDLVLSADFVVRQFKHTNFQASSIDLNHYNSARGPVIPKCAGAQAADPKAECSTGPITFWVPGGRASYKGLLVKLDKRFSSRYQFTASYALASQKTVNDVNSNPDNYFQTYGPYNPRHTLNISGTVDLPWKFHVSMISSFISRSPVMPSIASVDLAGAGGTLTYLPGASWDSQFNFGMSKSDLAKLVDQFNTTYAGKKDPRGQSIPTLKLPAHYDLGPQFASQDVRVTKSFAYKERYKLDVFGEGFNIFNFANLTGFSNNLASSAFGQPTQRVGQVFGSGGPRAFQVGARVSF